VACFSPGVSSESGFEFDVANRGIPVYLADASVDSPAARHDLFRFRKNYIGASTNGVSVTLDDWVSEDLPDSKGDLLLQMDIEGFEYETLFSMSDDLLARCRIIVVEFHWLYALWSKPFFRLAGSAFRKVLQTHRCVHIHPNNAGSCITQKGITLPESAEFTFIRHDRVRKESKVTSFPHPLDRDNTARSTLVLPDSLYSR